MAACPSLLNHVALLRDVETVQELLTRVSFGILASGVGGTRCQCSVVLFVGRTFRISLFRTRQICWMSAALCETASSELPLRISSSFCAFEISASTPGCITTFRTIFSPMKLLQRIQVSPCPVSASDHNSACPSPSLFNAASLPPPYSSIVTYRISTSQLPVSAFLSRLTLMGKWA